MPLPSDRKARIVLGVSGGIAAYKACELVRLLKKQGHEVRVILTKNAENFISALTLSTLSEYPVLRSLSAGVDDLSSTSHIDLAQWGDIFLIAPATANSIAKITYGIADDALTTEVLAFTGRLLVAPAMNTRMWNAPITQENCRILKERGVEFIGPISGDLACGEIGIGKMSEPVEIAQYVERVWADEPEKKKLKGKKILITSGPTRSYLDSVRFLTNRSSGKMGHALALQAIEWGAEVVLITGPVEEKYSTLPHGRVIKIETNAELVAAAEAEIEKVDIVFGVAAVADYEFPGTRLGKLERKQDLVLELKPSIDILAKLAEKRMPGQVFVGFAAQSGGGDDSLEKAKEKLQRKKIDFIVFNDISRKDIGFDSDENEATILSSSGVEKFIKKMLKKELAKEILENVLRKL